MNISSLTQSDIKQIEKLVTRKEALQAEIDRINAELTAVFGGQAGADAAQGKPGSDFTHQKRGALKDAIIELLKGAGKPGIAVKEIAARVNARPGNIHVWFTSTGKKVKEIKKIAPATYAWVS
jgi:hypothetical protein